MRAMPGIIMSMRRGSWICRWRKSRQNRAIWDYGGKRIRNRHGNIGNHSQNSRYVMQ